MTSEKKRKFKTYHVTGIFGLWTMPRSLVKIKKEDNTLSGSIKVYSVSCELKLT
jgi:hypothetical protein